jgi:predicted RNase H-like HicB family nuclease
LKRKWLEIPEAISHGETLDELEKKIQEDTDYH